MLEHVVFAKRAMPKMDRTGDNSLGVQHNLQHNRGIN